MGFKTDEETGEEVFYLELRFSSVPNLSPKLVWDKPRITLSWLEEGKDNAGVTISGDPSNATMP